MRVYKTAEIRNVAVLGHGASGKTSLVDALAFVAGTSKRHGSVRDGTALTDYTPDEIERKYSINLAMAVAEWMDTKLNLIDTPGYLDFTGDAMAGVYAADAALIVLSGTAGVEVGTERVWDYAEQRGIPRMFCVSLMDKEHADFEKAFNQVKSILGKLDRSIQQLRDQRKTPAAVANPPQRPELGEGRLPLPDVEGDATSLAGTFLVRYRAGGDQGRVRPYAGLGLGAQWLELAEPEVVDDEDSSRLVQVVAGVEVELGRRVGLAGEYRYSHAEHELVTGPSVANFDYEGHHAAGAIVFHP